VGLEDDGSEDLDPVGDELTVTGLAQLARDRVEAHTAGALSGDKRRSPVRRAGANRGQGARDAARDELVLTRCRWTSRRWTSRSHESQRSCHASSRGSTSVKTWGRSSLAGTHL
jgi:hypothetical protein